MLGPLSSARLHLPLLTAADRELYCRLYTDAETLAGIGPPLTVDAAEQAFARVLRQMAAVPPRASYWRLVPRQAGVPSGLMALIRDRDDGDRPPSAEIGVLLPPRAQRLGHAADAIAALADRCFAATALQRLWTRHAPAHAAAAGLMRKLGFAPWPEAATSPDFVYWQLQRERWRPRAD